MPPDSLTPKMKRKLLQFFVPSLRQHPNWPVIISEGDSWFSFPIHANVVDNLDSMSQGRISLLRLEANGDKAVQMVGGKAKAKLAEYLRRYPVQALLFSGGGNDIVGADLLPLLREHSPGMSWEDCINKETFGCRLEGIRGAYLDLLHLRDEARPGCRIYIHKYDRATPSGKGAKIWGIRIGHWMKKYLEQKGILDPSDQQKIIDWFLARFGEVIDDVGGRPGVVVVETFGTLGPSEWNDELHPSRAGFRKIAEKFRARLREQFPQTF
jgi:hypothetical protein